MSAAQDQSAAQDPAGGPSSSGATSQASPGPRVVPPPVTRHVVVPVPENHILLSLPRAWFTNPLTTRVPASEYVVRLARELHRLEQAGRWQTLAEVLLPYLRWPTMLMLVFAEWDRAKRLQQRREQRQRDEERRAVRRRTE